MKIFREPLGSCQGASLGSQVHNFQGALRELPGSQFRELSSLSQGAVRELPGSQIQGANFTSLRMEGEEEAGSRRSMEGGASRRRWMEEEALPHM